MVSKKTWLGILVMVLVFGMTVVGCENGSTNSVDTSLNGYWINEYDFEIELNNGSYELFDYRGEPTEKGTYTTNGGKIKFTPIQYYFNGFSFNRFDIEEKWYSKKELETALKNSGEYSSGEITDKLNYYFLPYEGSLNGKKLTVLLKNEEELIFIKEH